MKNSTLNSTSFLTAVKEPSEPEAQTHLPLSLSVGEELVANVPKHPDNIKINTADQKMDFEDGSGNAVKPYPALLELPEVCVTSRGPACKDSTESPNLLPSASMNLGKKSQGLLHKASTLKRPTLKVSTKTGSDSVSNSVGKDLVKPQLQDGSSASELSDHVQPPAAPPAKLAAKSSVIMRKISITKPAATSVLHIPDTSPQVCTQLEITQTDTKNLNSEETPPRDNSCDPDAPKERKPKMSLLSKKGALKGDTEDPKQGGSKPDKRPQVKSAFQIFAGKMRAKVQSELPEGVNVFTEASKRLSQIWQGFTAEEKIPFEKEAAADKAAKSEAVDAWKKSNPKKRPCSDATATAATASHDALMQAAKPQNAFSLFCRDYRPQVKEDCPDINPQDLFRILQDTWKEANKEVKAVYEEEAKALRESFKAVSATNERITAKAPDSSDFKSRRGEMNLREADDVVEVTIPFKKGAVCPAKRSKNSLSKKRGKGASMKAARRMEDDSAAGRLLEAGMDKEEDEVDDWGWTQEAQAGMILCRSLDGKKFVVARENEGLDSVGLVDSRAVKHQRLHGPDATCQVPLQMLEEYEEYEKRFKAELHDRIARDGALDLDDLPPGSALEMCFVLGKLREPDQLLSKVDNKMGITDTVIRVPAMM
ncbi:hypothetical protein CEUSTIGMA_g241.t1 [Chlamydomonas eustigma]|uniref:HMG box domain-containing protein n=1 Tax=Chlamydomonas eustigma TaxID=1157962 RepID=A0A250WPL4_9CHLO|nr:hypothetical protein CEUSTIGMA_g241.t1 [Chlamydomonas eustigma]|eukprot:GAX72785.1 hypothetical protein CEUSTIGMA_g241.t1 [Chlamydomonas eustigma]